VHTHAIRVTTRLLACTMVDRPMIIVGRSEVVDVVGVVSQFLFEAICSMISKYSPQLEAAFHRRKRPVWLSWRMDETVRRIGCMEEHSQRLSELLGNSVRTRLTHTRKGSKTPKGDGDCSMSGKAVREAKRSSRAPAA
jgi:asparagine synthetase B (glutamine-hydrolysing)